MPSLVSDGSESESDWNVESECERDFEFCQQQFNTNCNNVLSENNLKFLNYNEFKVNASKLTELPDNLDSTKTAGVVYDGCVVCNNNQTYTNGRYENGKVHNYDDLFNDDTNVIVITGNNDPKIPCILFSNAIYSVENENLLLYGQYDRNNYQNDELEDIYYGNTKVIRSKDSNWYVHVPIRYQNGETEKTWIFADSGANTPCVKTKWAMDNFPDMIAMNKIPRVMLTPGGPIKPKYSLWMIFPAKKNTVLKVKMNLVDDLPVDVLADITMLEAFGYTFRDETPPIFRHDEKPEIELDLKEDDEFISNRSENWFEHVTQMKINQITNGVSNIHDDDKISIVDTIYGENGNIIYDSYRANRNYLNTIVTDEQFDEKKDNNINNNTLVELEREKNNERVKVDCSKHNITKIVDNLNGNSNENCKVWKKCLFLTSKEAYLATNEEIAKAQEVFENKKLKFPDYSYLKSYEKKYGKQYAGLYDEVMKWKEKYKQIFATHTFSRKTMYTSPARLGIKPEHEDKIMFCPQYPISAEKRIHMINYTLINEKNGFWYKIPRSKHGIPYLMVPKKDATGAVARYRPAFDARIVNQYCKLMQCKMPTLKDFKNLHQRGGLTTLADIKNFFDCIPLHWKDRKYAVCFTPIGIYCMLCMTYGFMNAAPEAQKRTNDLVYNVTNALAYIDDIQIKHPLADGTRGVIESLTRLGDYCIEKNIQLNPKKFYPATDESDSFGFKNTLIGEMVSDSYKRKLLAVAKPKTRKEMQSFDGLCNYVNNHIFNNKKIFYWLNQLKEEQVEGQKYSRLKWTKQANLAWEQLQYLFNNLPLLHHPNKNGQFLLVTDACNYGIGAALYQDHSGEGQPVDWKLIDLWSKAMPTQLRHCHSMIHEAYGVVSACEHWQFYLIRARFILSTDSMNVARIFGQSWKDLSPITQKQLIRLRSKLNSFNFISFHLPGFKNELADGLSRFTIELLKRHENDTDNILPLNLEVIESDDTMTPKLNDKQRKEFDMIKNECEMLENRYNKAKNSKVKREMINIITDAYYGEITTIKMKNDMKTIDRVMSTFRLYNKEIDKGFDSLLHEYQNNGDYLERDNLKEFIQYGRINCIRKSDDSMTQDELDQFKNTMCNTIENLNEMLDETVCDLENEIGDEYWNHLSEMRIINQIMDNEYVNALDEDYDPFRERDFGRAEKVIEPSPIITRSKAKRMKEKEREDVQDDDTIEQERIFSRINVDFNNIRDEMDSHEDFMMKIFGRRNRMDILDFTKYREYQESDNLLALVIKLFKQPNRDLWEDDDLDLLWEQDEMLYMKLINDGLLIEDNILKCYDFHPVTQEQCIKIIVPFFLRGRLMDHAHHNLQHHHLSERYTWRKLATTFWWGGIYTDVVKFCNQCISCQFSKGYPRKRAPLMERYRPLPRQHVFADILGPVYQRYYILVLVDYATGYSMLIPMNGCDSRSIAQAIINHWIRIFGYFQILETDWGSGFTSKLFGYLNSLLGVHHEVAEPRNHRSIGKVERVIGFLQAIINHYNLILGKELTDFADANVAWTRIKVLLPFIQLGFNQRVMRITGISPNMAIFGTNMNDITDIARMNAKIDEFGNDRKLDKRDFILLRNIRDDINNMNKIADSNWKKITKLSVKEYNNKYNITLESIMRNRERFQEGDQVLYFIGDKQTARYKWREKWSGPWILEKRINDATLILSDPRNGNQKRVSIDRVKKFNDTDYLEYDEFIELDKQYLQFQEEMLKMMSNYQVRVASNEWDLDYSKFNTSKISIDVDEILEQQQQQQNSNENE